jgi:hypothetical protein
MWALALFFAIIGFMRGWNREIGATAGIFLGMFALFQLDSLLRTIMIWLGIIQRDQMFLIQASIFLAIVFFAYQNRVLVGGGRRREGTRDNLQSNLLGSMMGFVNGYLVGGSLWYFLDINEYPLAPLVLAPTAGSPSDQARDILPMVLLSGGVNGSGDFLAVAAIVLILVVFVML